MTLVVMGFPLAVSRNSAMTSWKRSLGAVYARRLSDPSCDEFYLGCVEELGHDLLEAIVGGRSMLGY